MPTRTCMLLALCAVACGDPCDTPAVGQVCRVAGTGEMGFNDDGLLAAETDLYLPSQARRGPDGLVYVMDFNNHRLRRIGDDERVSTVAGDGFHAIATPGGPAVESSLENPIEFDFLADGRPALISYHDPRVLVIEDDGTLAVLAGSGQIGITGAEGDGGPALQAEFIELTGIAITPEGDLYLSDDKANRVRVVRDGIVSTVLDPTVVEAPSGLALDGDGNLYVADYAHHVVRRVTPEGAHSVVAGTGVEGREGDGGPATEAQLAGPYGVAVDDDGVLYIGMREGFCVRRVDPDGTIETVVGTGERGLEGDGGPALDATFGFVAGVSVDGDGLLIADQTNSVVRRVRLR